MLKVKVYFEVYPGQLGEHVYVNNYPSTYEKVGRSRSHAS
jgi:hypothetical protein